jgi:hypothetical protein
MKKAINWNTMSIIGVISPSAAFVLNFCRRINKPYSKTDVGRCGVRF